MHRICEPRLGPPPPAQSRTVGRAAAVGPTRRTGLSPRMHRGGASDDRRRPAARERRARRRHRRGDVRPGPARPGPARGLRTVTTTTGRFSRPARGSKPRARPLSRRTLFPPAHRREPGPHRTDGLGGPSRSAARDRDRRPAADGLAATRGCGGGKPARRPAGTARRGRLGAPGAAPRRRLAAPRRALQKAPPSWLQLVAATAPSAARARCRAHRAARTRIGCSDSESARPRGRLGPPPAAATVTAAVTGGAAAPAPRAARPDNRPQSPGPARPCSVRPGSARPDPTRPGPA